MANLASFLSDPVQFMRSNHVAFVGVSPAQQGGGVYEFILRDLGKAARARASVFLGVVLRKVDAGVFEIRYKGALDPGDPRLAEGETFRAIWSGYVPGGKAECVLDGAGDVDIMLTPELTGCTVAFASQPNGDARFSHYNLLGTGRQTLRASGMVAEARSDYRGVGNLGVVTKEHYRGKSSAGDDQQFNPKLGHVWEQYRSRPAASVIGRRVGGRWGFWIQYTCCKGSVQQILAVKQLTPGIKIG